MKKQATSQSSRRVLLAVAAFSALAFSPSLAADWEVEENTTLTADKTVDALTVNTGVTLDLNGYKLTCTSLAGEGTITSTYSDLTTSGGTCWASQSEAQDSHGVVANLFNNNFTYTTDASHRFLLSSSKLPVCIDYDFGAGNAQVVNAYKLWAGWKQRAPKAWTLYGSNNDSAYQADSETDWVAIDSHSGEEDWWQTNGNAKDYTADDNTYTCDNTTAYRYYRLKVTERVGSNGYFELVQLEYFDTTPGELHIDVASGSTAWPSSITFSGNVKVVKDGAGTLAGAFQLDDVDFVIESGTVAASGNDMHIGSNVGKSASVTVNGGTLSVSGKQFKVGYYGTGTLTVNEGGTVVVDSGYNTYIAEQSGSSGTINLNGGTLITRRVQNGSGTTPTLNFNGGTLKTNLALSSYGLIRAGITVNVGEGGGTIDSGNLSDATSGNRVFIAAAIGGEGAMRFKGGKTINLEGAMGWTGGTTVELGTRLYVADNEKSATTKSTVLGNLTVDGITYTEDTADIPVFAYAAGGLTASDLEHITFANCGATTAAELADDTTIQVDFVAPVWELTADTTWSALFAEHGTPAADASVIINAASAYTLTIDTDAMVGSLAFTGAGSTTLAVSSDQTLTVGDITGVGAISNSGTIVKTGSGTATLPFDNASTGEVIVNAGTLKVGSKTGEGTEYTVRVKGGATYDVNGVGEVTVKVILEKGAFFTNTGSAITSGRQTVSLTLEGDATVTATKGFGLVGPNHAATTINLDTYTLTVGGTDGQNFDIDNTTINGTGKILVVDGGRLRTQNNASAGANCSLELANNARLGLGRGLSVRNFVNNSGNDTEGGSELTVTGTLTPGSAVRNLKLADGATVKATGTAQVVSGGFAASGTINIDASDITSQQLTGATEDGIPVLTVPVGASTDSVTWKVTDASATNARRRWVDDAGGTTKTLRLVKPTGLILIFR